MIEKKKNRFISSEKLSIPFVNPQLEKLWTYGLTSLYFYKGWCYHVEVIVRKQNQYIAYVVYPLDLFGEVSVTNIFTSIVANVLGFMAPCVFYVWRICESLPLILKLAKVCLTASKLGEIIWIGTAVPYYDVLFLHSSNSHFLKPTKKLSK